MTPADPLGARQRKKAETREALLAAARAVLTRRGLAKATTREIAAEAGVAAGTFFVHFRDLDALVEALLDAHVAATLDAALRSAARRRGVVARLVHVAGCLYASYEVEPELSKAYIAASLFAATPDGQVTARLATFRAWVVAQLDEAIARGEVPEVDREVAFTGFFSLYFGILVAGLSGVLPRKRQLALLEASLRRLLLLEAS